MDSVSPIETRTAGRSSSDLAGRFAFTRVEKRFTGTTEHWRCPICVQHDRDTLHRPARLAGLARCS